MSQSQWPSSVEAVTVPQVGGVEVIEKKTIPFPKVNPGDIVIKVEYFGVNFIDTYYRSGLYKFKELPAVLGSEAAGIIVSLPTDQDVLNNETYKKQDFAVGGKVAVTFLGVHATYISVPWKSAFPVPSSISTQVASASLLQGITAVSFFEEAYKVKKGDTVLVHTVAGGVGLLFAQLGRHIGARVIGTTSTQAKADLAKANGADHVILYPVEDTVKRVLELTNNEGVDAVFDGVGMDTFDNNFKLIKRKGTIVSYGNTSGPVEPFSITKLVEKNVKLLRPTMSNYISTAEESAHYGKEVFDLVDKNELKIQIFKEYPFTTEGVQNAQRDLTGGKTNGKLLIKVA